MKHFLTKVGWRVIVTNLILAELMGREVQGTWIFFAGWSRRPTWARGCWSSLFDQEDQHG